MDYHLDLSVLLSELSTCTISFQEEEGFIQQKESLIQKNGSINWIKSLESIRRTMIDKYICTVCGEERLGASSVGGYCHDCLAQQGNDVERGVICYECWALGKKHCNKHILSGQKCGNCGKEIPSGESSLGRCEQCQQLLCNECISKGTTFCLKHDPVEKCIRLIEERFKKYLRTKVLLDEIINMDMDKKIAIEAIKRMSDSQQYSIEDINESACLVRK